jgi:hypothetical protein
MPTAMHFVRGNMLMGYLKASELTAIQTHMGNLNNGATRKALADLGEKLLGRVFNCRGDAGSVYYLRADDIIEKLCVALLHYDTNMKFRVKWKKTTRS